MPHRRIAINISAVQFKQKDLLDTIKYALETSGLSPEFLEVEVTETVVMQNASQAIVTLEKLSEMGIHVSIDDFGTGYSSLGYLKRFQSISSRSIARSSARFHRTGTMPLSYARLLRWRITSRLRVIAEGVETEDQLQFLRALGCDEYQGYYKSKPVPANEFARQMRSEIWSQHRERQAAPEPLYDMPLSRGRST